MKKVMKVRTLADQVVVWALKDKDNGLGCWRCHGCDTEAENVGPDSAAEHAKSCVFF